MPWKDQWIYQHNGPACLKIYLLSIKSKIFNHMYVCFLHRWCRKLYKEMTSFSGWPTVLKAKHRLNPIKSPASNNCMEYDTWCTVLWKPLLPSASYNRSPWNLSLMLSLITDWRRFYTATTLSSRLIAVKLFNKSIHRQQKPTSTTDYFSRPLSFDKSELQYPRQVKRQTEWDVHAWLLTFFIEEANKNNVP